VSRKAKIAVVITGLTLLLCGGGCLASFALGPSLPALVGCDEGGRRPVGTVIDRPQRLRELYPKLGAMTTVHWQEREGRPRRCPEPGPMPIITSGLIVFAPDVAERYRTTYTWTDTASPDVPEDLRGYAPKSAHWSSSPAFSQDFAGTGDKIAFDTSSGTLYFEHTKL
jgi:hypothetical protein